MDINHNQDDFSLYAFLLLSITASVLFRLSLVASKKKLSETTTDDLSRRLAFIIWINKNREPLHKTVSGFIKEHQYDTGVELILLTNPNNITDLKSLPSSVQVGDVSKITEFRLNDGRRINPQDIIESSIQLTLQKGTPHMLAIVSDFIRLLMLARPKEVLEQVIHPASMKKNALLTCAEKGSDILYTDCDVKIDLTQNFTGLFPIFHILDQSNPYFFFRNDVMYASQSSREIFLSIITVLLSIEKYETFKQLHDKLERIESKDNASIVIDQFEDTLQSYLPVNLVYPEKQSNTTRLWSMALAGFHPAAAIQVNDTIDETSPHALRECMRTGNLVVFASREVESEVVSADNVPNGHDMHLSINGKPHRLSVIAFKHLSHHLPPDMGKSWDGSGDLSNMEAANVIYRSPHSL